jgi:hypothetical protein
MSLGVRAEKRLNTTALENASYQSNQLQTGVDTML